MKQPLSESDLEVLRKWLELNDQVADDPPDSDDQQASPARPGMNGLSAQELRAAGAFDMPPSWRKRLCLTDDPKSKSKSKFETGLFSFMQDDAEVERDPDEADPDESDWDDDSVEDEDGDD